MPVWNRLTAFVTGGAVAAAASDAIAPELEPLKQTAWRNAPHRVLAPLAAAELRVRETTDRVKGIDLEGVELADDAARSGLGSHRFNLLTELARTEPGVGELIRLRRRGIETGNKAGISAAELELALRRSGYTAEHVAAIVALVHERLDPAVVAVAIVRGILKDPGFLPVGPPEAEGKVKAFPTSPLDPLDEAAAAGWDRARLFVQTAISGRPMGPEAAADSVFRGILEPVDYERAVAEGDVRNEWAQAIFEHARQIATVADYVNAHLRGWIDEAAMYAGAARHGMSKADVRLIYLRSGRPAAPGQMWTAIARGVDGPEGRPMDKDQFLKGIRESDIRPEWGEMLYSIRHLYPSLFQLGRLVESGAIDGDTGSDWAHKARYAPEVVTALRKAWDRAATEGDRELTAAELADEYVGHYLDEPAFRAALEGLGYAPAAVDLKVELLDARRVRKARQQRESRIHSSYVGHKITHDDAINALSLAGVPPTARDLLMVEWDGEREVNVRVLTPAQIRKAFVKGIRPRDWALDQLEDQGMSTEAAEIFLDEA